MIVPVMAISNLVLPRQIYSEETNGAHEKNKSRPFNMKKALGQLLLRWTPWDLQYVSIL